MPQAPTVPTNFSPRVFIQPALYLRILRLYEETPRLHVVARKLGGWRPDYVGRCLHQLGVTLPTPPRTSLLVVNTSQKLAQIKQALEFLSGRWVLLVERKWVRFQHADEIGALIPSPSFQEPARCTLRQYQTVAYAYAQTPGLAAVTEWLALDPGIIRRALEDMHLTGREIHTPRLREKTQDYAWELGGYVTLAQMVQGTDG